MKDVYATYNINNLWTIGAKVTFWSSEIQLRIHFLPLK